MIEFLAHKFHEGGVAVMGSITFVLFMVIIITLERLIRLWWTYPQQDTPGFVAAIQKMIMSDSIEDAIRLCQKASPALVADVLHEGLKRANDTMEEVEYADDVLAVINPKIVDGFGEITIQEGCLSIPGEMFFVQRAPFITVEYQDVTGQINTLSASGIVSIAIQHEMDHLDGILLVDNVDRERKQLILETVSSRSNEEGDLYTVYGGD